MLELATLADHGAVNAIKTQIHALHVAYRPDLFCMAPELYPLDQFREDILKRLLYVAKREGQVVGYVRMEVRDYDRPGFVPRRVMLLDEFGVTEALRGHGIGAAMMADVKALAKVFRCSDLQLSVYPQNDEAVSFYQKMGLMIRCIGMQMKI